MQKKKLNLKETVTSSFGIGLSIFKNIESQIGLNKKAKISTLNQNKFSCYKKIEQKIKTNKTLKFLIRDALHFKQKIKCYVGIRNSLRYPSRGQRTHTNARTKKKFQFK
jgi:small subunit ribosomal protein S13